MPHVGKVVTEFCYYVSAGYIINSELVLAPESDSFMLRYYCLLTDNLLRWILLWLRHFLKLANNFELIFVSWMTGLMHLLFSAVT